MIYCSFASYWINHTARWQRLNVISGSKIGGKFDDAVEACYSLRCRTVDVLLVLFFIPELVCTA